MDEHEILSEFYYEAAGAGDYSRTRLAMDALAGDRQAARECLRIFEEWRAVERAETGEAK